MTASALRYLQRNAIAIAALFIALGGTSYAMVGGGFVDPEGQVLACVNTKSGGVRLVRRAATCRSHELLVWWNQKGRPGRTGDMGASGQNGVSVIGAALASGDPHCALGGSAFTSSNATTYACNGKDGTDGVSVTGAALATGDSNCPFGGSKFTAANGVTYACNGETGASAGYWNQNQVLTDYPADPAFFAGKESGPATLVTLTVPAGSYVVTAKAAYATAPSGATGDIGCSLLPGGSTTPIDIGNGQSTSAANGVLAFTGPLTVTAPTQVKMSCTFQAATGIANASITAVQVRTLGPATP